MAEVVLSDPTLYNAGKPAQGPIVQSDLQAIVNQFNGNIDQTNILDGEITTSKLNDAAVTNTKIAANAVRESHVYFGSAASGLLVARVGPNYAGNGAPRLARVYKNHTTAGGASENITVTFASDCLDGDPGFIASPVLLGHPTFIYNDGGTVNSADMVDYCYIYDISSSQCDIHVAYLGGGAAASIVMIIEFGLLGTIV